MWIASGLLMAAAIHESDGPKSADRASQLRGSLSGCGVPDEASQSPSRICFGVVGPTRATRLAIPSVDLVSSRLTRPCGGDAGS
jgi:hypothetical protein